MELETAMSPAVPVHLPRSFQGLTEDTSCPPPQVPSRLIHTFSSWQDSHTDLPIPPSEDAAAKLSSPGQVHLGALPIKHPGSQLHAAHFQIPPRTFPHVLESIKSHQEEADSELTSSF